MSSEDLVFNGINGATGDYLLKPMSPPELSAAIRCEPPDPEHLRDLSYWHQYVSEESMGPIEGVDPTRLDQSGWGVIFAHDADPAIREALQELLALRREQAGEYYREYVKNHAYQAGESKSGFLARHHAGPGPADPGKVPYYLLIVGDPETIPYRFQYQLDVQYAVGRICFDTLEEYARYARSVVMAETGQVTLPRRAAFFGVQNRSDRATTLSAKELTKPLANWIADDQPGWQIQTCLSKQATKAQLTRLLGGDQTPALLFTASHGMGFPLKDPRQLPHQGALLCQDWPGPGKWEGPIPQDFYFAGDDLASHARLAGLLTFHYACYGAGTPRLDDYAHRTSEKPEAIARHAFVANLPQRLLSHPKGGVLAAVGHVDRAWDYSYMWAQAGPQRTAFESSLKRLMEGHPVGSALDYFGQRYAELSTMLSTELEDIKFGKEPNDLALARMWTANNDARSYVIVGDPAVRLPVADQAAAERPVMDSIVLPTLKPEPPPPATPFTGPQTPIGAGEAVGPGLLGQLDEVQVRQAAESLFANVTQVSQALEQVLEDLSGSFVVETYLSDDMTKAGQPEDAELRIYTRVQPDGDTQVVLPQQWKEIDEDLWRMHNDAVREARTSRAAELQGIVAALKKLLSPSE
jgi:hypothetical protein